MPQTNRGNILFLILLAVVLFAALSYAVTSSMRGGGKDGPTENARAMAADIINYAVLVESETTRLMLVNDVRWEQVDFYNNNTHKTLGGVINSSPYGHNPNCTALAGKQCAVFLESGGSAASREFYKYSEMVITTSNGHPVPGEAQFFNKIVRNIGTDAPEIVMFIVRLKKPICDAINTQLGLPLADSTTTIATTYRGVREYYTEDTDSVNILPGPNPAYYGQKTFCYKQSDGYTFAHIIIER